FLNQVKKSHSAIKVFLGHTDDQPEVCFGQLALGATGLSTDAIQVFGKLEAAVPEHLGEHARSRKIVQPVRPGEQAPDGRRKQSGIDGNRDDVPANVFGVFATPTRDLLQARGLQIIVDRLAQPRIDQKGRYVVDRREVENRGKLGEEVA